MYSPNFIINKLLIKFMSLRKTFGVSKKIGRESGKLLKKDKLAKASEADEPLL